MLKFALPLVAILLSAQTARAQQPRNCQTGQIIIENNFDAPATMTVRSGKTCRRDFRSVRFKLDNIQFVKMPTHGTLKTVGQFSYIYTAKQGYTGADSFHIRYVGSLVDGAGNKGVDTFQGIKWTVNVLQ
jgi:hypothetical protein